MTHLHVHTKYSLLDATIKIEDIANKLRDMGQTAIAITDHGNLYGAVEAYKILSEQGIKVITGCEMYICDDVNIKDKSSKYYHLILLCKNDTGRRNLNKLVSESTLYKYYGKPRIDFPMLEKYHEGLICMSACMAGEVSRAIVDNDIDHAKSIIRKYHKLFGDDYYIEYQSHEDTEQQKLNTVLIKLAIEMGIKYAVTSDAHYLNKEDQKYHSLFVQIGSTREVGETYNDCYLQSEQEILDKCYLTKRYNEEAIKTTDEIAAKCENTIPLSAPIIPHVHIPEEFNSELEYLKYLSNEGFKNKGFATWNEQQWRDYLTETVEINGETVIREIIPFSSVKEIRNMYFDRARYEMNAIEKMGFEGYYLLVHSYVSCVKRRGIARGSGGGSLIAYLSGIVDIDPIKYGLYFERFIDVSALSLLENGSITKKQLKIPDFDVDFAPSERALALDFVVDKYGRDNVVALGQFGYILAKGAIKDIGRVLGIPFETTNQITKNLDGNTTIDEALELGLLDEYKKVYPELFEYASKLAGLPKSFGVHPCFTGETLVMTENGVKRIDNIEVGDKVLTHKGNYKLVVKTMCNNADIINTINVCGAYDINCTPNHPFYVKRRISDKPRKYSEPQWIEAKDIILTDMLCLPIDKKTKTPPYNLFSTYTDVPCDNKFYDPDNNCLWVYVKKNEQHESDNTLVYNLSVVDDNSYTANGIAVHNCGKVPTMSPAVEYNAIEYNEKTNEWVLQGDMHTADDLGLVKCDFLGLRTLDVIYDVLDMIGKDYNYIAPHRIDTNDKLTWQEFANGHTDCIFQFESQGMKHMLADMKCDNIENLSAANALYRPGSKDYIPNYVNRKNGDEEITYLHPDLKPILSNSYGIIVFQEQLIEIGRFAGLSNPDELRKATAKKIPKLMAKIEPELKQGLMNKGWTQSQVDELWQTILQFAKYSFNKSHSSAYALTAYISMYLKVHHTAEFIAACINSYAGDITNISKTIREGLRMGVEIKFRDWRTINATTEQENGVVYLGIDTIKGFGASAANALHRISATANTFIDFLKAVKNESDLSDAQVKKMIIHNFFSEFGDAGTLLHIHQLFQNIYGRKQFDKKSAIPVDTEILKLFSKETPKQFREIRSEELFDYLCANSEPCKLPVVMILNAELEDFGYIKYRNEAAKSYYYVISVDTKYSPKLKLYDMCSGETIDCKVSKKTFNQKPICVGSLVKAIIKEKPKVMKTDDGWQELAGQFDKWLETYIVKK